MEREAIERAADLLARARLAGARVAHLPGELRPEGEAAAYDVQEALHGRLAAAGRGAQAGHKIGCTTQVMQRYLGIANPCAGGILVPQVNRDRAVLRYDAFLRPGVECELAVTLSADLPAGGAPYHRDRVAGAVEGLMAAIEIVDDRYRDYRTFDTPTLIADDFFNAGCVLGPAVETWRELEITRLMGRMLINGVEVGRGWSRDILGHPFEALAWLATMRAGRGTPLRAGEFVLLGSLVQTVWLEPGDRVAIEVEGLGGAELVLT
jgi:2-keto-4-pentenoate hydratase